MFRFSRTAQNNGLKRKQDFVIPTELLEIHYPSTKLKLESDLSLALSSDYDYCLGVTFKTFA